MSMNSSSTGNYSDKHKIGEIGSRGNAAGLRQQRQNTENIRNHMGASYCKTEMEKPFSGVRSEIHRISSPVIGSEFFKKKITFGDSRN